MATGFPAPLNEIRQQEEHLEYVNECDISKVEI
jgi:hypothetical protein